MVVNVSGCVLGLLGDAAIREALKGYTVLFEFARTGDNRRFYCNPAAPPLS